MLTDPKELQDIIKDLVVWVNSDELRSTEMMAYIHGYEAPRDFAEHAGDIWEKARKAVDMEFEQDQEQ